MITLRILMLIAAIISLAVFLFVERAQRQSKDTIGKYKEMASKQGLTGAQAAQMMLQQSNVSSPVCETESDLEDSYNTETKTLYLSRDVFRGTSVSDIGVACVEAGHAIQHAQSYTPSKIRSSISRITDACFIPSCFLVVVGICCGFGGLKWMLPVAYVGVAALLLPVIGALMKSTTEINACRRAFKYLTDNHSLTDAETDGIDKVLRSKMTIQKMSAILLLVDWLYLLAAVCIG